MNKKTIIIMLFSLLCLVSCNSSFEQSFDKLIRIKNDDCLNTVNMHSVDNVSNDYKNLFLMGKEINSNLLNIAISDKETKYRLCSMAFYLTEGDISICLLLDINEIGDKEFEMLIPEQLIEKYKSSGASVWWLWIQGSIANRKWVIDKISSLL